MCSGGASNPVSIMSLTITICSGSSGSLQPLLDDLIHRIAADVLGDRTGVGRGAGVDDLDHALVDGIVMPVGTQLDDLVVESARRSRGSHRR